MSAVRETSLPFDNQVAVVTGAGRGMGRSYALSLASMGACVVVNDLGVDVWGSGADQDVASVVVDEITRAGGRAVASTASVATPEGGESIIATALEHYGRIDVLVHNAGIRQLASFSETSNEDLLRVLQTNLLSAWYVGQPAWASMMQNGYGRIVLTSSASIFGLANTGVYMAAKAGLIGLTKSLDAEAREQGNADIKTNAILPLAATRMSTSGQRDIWRGLNDPAEVAPLVAYLASRECTISGRALAVSGTHIAQMRLALSEGWAKKAPGMDAGEVAAHLDEILDDSGPTWSPESTVAYLADTFERVMGTKMPGSSDPAVGFNAELEQT